MTAKCQTLAWSWSPPESPNTKRRRINRERREEIARQDRAYEDAQMADIVKQIAEAERKETEARGDAAKKELVGLLNMDPIPKRLSRRPRIVGRLAGPGHQGIRGFGTESIAKDGLYHSGDTSCS